MGSVIDLARPDVQLPDEVVVDSNVIAMRLLGAYHPSESAAVVRAEGFFRSLIAASGVGIVTPTVFVETLHVAIKGKYRSELANHGTALAARYGPRRRYDWLALYTLDAGIAQAFVADLDRMRRQLAANNLIFLAPDDLGPIPSGLPFDAELVRPIGRYGLDTSDTAILLEARRAGLSAIVSLDPDMRRAGIDFDVYTWA